MNIQAMAGISINNINIEKKDLCKNGIFHHSWEENDEHFELAKSILTFHVEILSLWSTANIE